MEDMYANREYVNEDMHVTGRHHWIDTLFIGGWQKQ